MATAAPRSTTWADAAALALGPALIMSLVGSLVFFLAEVCYAGQYSFRLNWTLGFFVVGCVLVARIAIELDHERANLYGAILGAAAYIALLQFVEYPKGTFATHFGWAINIGFLAIVWWSAQKLTWDCTFIDENREADDRGLLDAALGEAPPTPQASRLEPKAVDRRSWWERYRAYRAACEHQPHTPGVWVVYFSLAALPLFGLGGALIPAAALDRRQYAMWLLTVYVASGLGLLLSTTFLGLRRYLRQRGVTMPGRLTATWAGIGGGLILALVLGAALLPRPTGDYSPLQFLRGDSAERKPSDYAVLREGGAKGQGRAGTKNDPNGQAPSDQANGAQQPGDQESQGQGKGGQGQGDGKSDQAKGNQGEQGQGKGEQKNGEPGKDGQGDGKKEPGDGNQSEARKSGDESKKDGARDGQSRQSEQTKASSPPPSAVAAVAELLKWIVFILVVLAVIAAVVYLLVRHLAHFTDWARNWLEAWNRWWASLFGTSATAEEESAVVVPAPRRRPFAEFHNPFAGGDSNRPPAELVRYSFAALEAWAVERNLGRPPDETPLEFAHRLTPTDADLATEARQLAQLVGRLAYAARAIAQIDGADLGAVLGSLDASATTGGERMTQPSFVYPDTDGQPMAQNMRQGRWILTLVNGLTDQFEREPNVLIAADNFWYPREGDPDTRTAPDVYVVLGRPRGDRSSYLQWEENDVPITVAFEIRSPGNSQREMDEKLQFYDEFGVSEYYDYDPDAHELIAYTRGLQALRRQNVRTSFTSPLLDLRFDMTGTELVVYGRDGQPFLTTDERAQSKRRLQEQLTHQETELTRLRRIAELSRKALRQQASADELHELDELERGQR